MRKKRMTKHIIMCAGDSKKWKNYLGIPRHLIEINGEPILHRTIRLIKERSDNEIIITITEKGALGDLSKLGVKEVISGTGHSSKRLFFLEKYLENYRVIAFEGDVYFTEKAIDTILSNNDDWAYFGRRHKSNITGKPWGEVFAYIINQYVIDKAKELVAKYGLVSPFMWKVYRFANGYDINKHMTGKHFININDFTEDFDKPKDYDNWIKKLKEKTK